MRHSGLNSFGTELGLAVVLLRLLDEVFEVELCWLSVLDDSRGRPSACNFFVLDFLAFVGRLVDTFVAVDLLRNESCPLTVGMEH